MMHDFSPEICCFAGIAACDEAVGRMSTTGVGEEPLQKINASIDISEKVSPTEANTAILCIAAVGRDISFSSTK